MDALATLKDEEPGKPGRPLALTADVQARVVQSLQKGCFRYSAARAAGISVRTFERAMKAGSEEPDGDFGAFYLAVQEAEQKAELTQLQRVIDAGAADWKAAAWFLERKFPKRWGRKQQVEIAGNQKKPLKVSNMSSAYDRLAQRIAALRFPRDIAQECARAEGRTELASWDGQSTNASARQEPASEPLRG